MKALLRLYPFALALAACASGTTQTSGASTSETVSAATSASGTAGTSSVNRSATTASSGTSGATSTGGSTAANAGLTASTGLGSTGASSGASGSALPTSTGGDIGPATSSSSGSTTGSSVVAAASSTGSSGGLSSTGSSGTTGTSGTSVVADPAATGPYTFAEINATTTSALSSDSVPLYCAYPASGPDQGPFPVVVFAPGFEIPAAQYDLYAQWLAAFGYVAIVANYPQSPLAPDHVAAAQDLSAALDWALQAGQSGSGSPLSGLVASNAAGVSGHSLGGKLAILAASYDPRFTAVLTLDAVDGSMNCSATDCPNAASVLPLPIPTGFLGETLDEASGSLLGGACAPKASNYDTLYQLAASPSLEVTLAGAGHMSFVQSISACGLVCSFCETPTAPQAQVLSLAEAYLVAFFGMNLKNEADYQAYLTGAQAQTRYVATGQATIVSK